jgi:predicted CDP-diglyceride synthetase/phosphatidate cytidylyltransferase
VAGTGFDSPQKFTLQYADEIRYMGNENYVNMINEIYVDDETGILYVYLATPINKSKLDIDYFSIRRFVDDVGFIMINGDGGNTDGFIFPKYPSTVLKNNLSKIQKDLITSGQIPG